MKRDFAECKCIYECCDYDYGFVSWYPISLGSIDPSYASSDIIIGYIPSMGWYKDYDEEPTRDSDTFFEQYIDFTTYQDKVTDIKEPVKEVFKYGYGKLLGMSSDLDMGILKGYIEGKLGEATFDAFLKYLISTGHFMTAEEWKLQKQLKMKEFSDKCKNFCAKKKGGKR
jgi:hypothetical protein